MKKLTKKEMQESLKELGQIVPVPAFKITKKFVKYANNKMNNQFQILIGYQTVFNDDKIFIFSPTFFKEHFIYAGHGITTMFNILNSKNKPEIFKNVNVKMYFKKE